MLGLAAAAVIAIGGVMFVWNIADPTWTSANEQYWWAITNPDGTPRPAYNSLMAARTTGVLP